MNDGIIKEKKKNYQKFKIQMVSAREMTKMLQSIYGWVKSPPLVIPKAATVIKCLLFTSNS